MSRPTRMATAKLKNYAEMNDGSDDEVISISDGESDDSFDEDDDPDKIEVPGGGSNLADSIHRAPPPPNKPSSSSNPLLGPPTSGGGVPFPHNPRHAPNILKVKVRGPHGAGGHTTGTTLIPPTHGNQLPKFNLPEGTSIRPTSGGGGRPPGGALFDPTAFLTNPYNTNPMGSLNSLNSFGGGGSLDGISALLSMFPKANPSSLHNIASNPNNPLLQSMAAAAPNNAFLQLCGLLAGNQMMSNMGRGSPAFPPGLDVRAGIHGNANPHQMWTGGNAPPPKQKVEVEVEEEIQEDDEALGLADTYADYTPAKLPYGKPHPDPIVETASLGSVQPPEVYYKLLLPHKIIDKGLLSALQLEAVVYACQNHEFVLPTGERAGYLVGDGAGVGKGRTIAGIIYENWLSGRKKALWVSVSADLKEDSIRDLNDIGAGNIKVIALNKLKYGKIKREDHKDGVLFSTYSGLIGESSTGGKFNARLKQIIDWLGKEFDGVIVFDECHRAKNLCPVGNTKPTKTGVTVQKLQEELPKARVVYASATGASEPKNMAYMTRLGIWGRATPFNKFADFINAVEKRGIGAMEIVAMDMKLRGAYIARQLSFKGVTFNIEEVALNEDFQKMYNDSVDLWVEALQKFIEAAELMKADKAFRKTMWAQFWASHQRYFKYMCIAGKVDRAIEIAREAVKDGKCVVIGLQSTGEARTAEQIEREGELDDFVSTAKGVFQSLVEKHLPAPDRGKIRRLLGLPLVDAAEPQPSSSSSSGKGKPMRRAAQNAAKRSKWNDSDGSNNDDVDSDFSAADGTGSDSEVSIDSKASESDFESVSSEPESEEDGKGRKRKANKNKASKSSTVPRDVPSKEALDRAFEIRRDLLEKIEKLGSRMPSNTLDHLIDELGGPSDVAEMTGRKMRLIQMENGKIEYQSRAENDVALDHINLTEKQRFMDGVKNIAIISEAASSGISLQSDRRAKNKRRRVHITLELPWSADRAIQQFGRTHRSNQVNAPEYVFLISDLAGEHRFASIVAKRLESLGALTHGDRRATETRDLSRFHIDNKYGKMALESVMRFIMTGNLTNIPALPPADYVGDGEFREDVAAGLVGVGLIVNEENSLIPDKDYHNMSKFLNRILGMHVNLQNSLFKFFTDTLAAIVANAKKQGRFDMGILNLGDSNADKTTLTSTQKFNRKHATGMGMVELHEVIVERGMSWEEAHTKQKELTGKHDGFYLQRDEKSNKKLAILIAGDDFAGSSSNSKRAEQDRYYSVYRPSTGLQMRREQLADLTSKYKKATSQEVITSWEAQYKDSGINCIHAFWSGNCKNRAAGLTCDVGKRQRTYYVLSGSVLLCWDDVESAMGRSQHAHKIQIVRVQFVDGMKFVGILIPGDSVKTLKGYLSKAEEAEMKKEDEKNGEDHAEGAEDFQRVE